MQADGSPLIDHLRKAERITGETPPELLHVPRCPQGCEELWSIFSELHRCRSYLAMAGPLPITYVDIDAYQRVTGTRLFEWERHAIRKADMAFLNDWHARNPAKPNP